MIRVAGHRISLSFDSLIVKLGSLGRKTDLYLRNKIYDWKKNSIFCTKLTNLTFTVHET